MWLDVKVVMTTNIAAIWFVGRRARLGYISGAGGGVSVSACEKGCKITSEQLVWTCFAQSWFAEICPPMHTEYLHICHDWGKKSGTYDEWGTEGGCRKEMHQVEWVGVFERSRHDLTHYCGPQGLCDKGHTISAGGVYLAHLVYRSKMQSLARV